MDCSMPGFPVHLQLLELAQTHVHWVGDDIQPSHPLSSPSPPAFNLSQCQGLFQWVPMSFSSSHQVAKSIGASASASVLPMNIQDWFPLGWIGLISCSPRDSQGSSPIPQFKSINCSVFSFLYSPTLTSIHDYWKNYSFDYIDLCRQSNVSVFNLLSVSHCFSSKGQEYFEFMPAVTIHSDSGAQEKKVCHCFHWLSIN